MHHGLQQHLPHLLPLVLALGLVTPGLRRWLSEQGADVAGRQCQLLAALLVAAGTVHALAARDHLRAGPAVMGFFLVTALLQGLLAVCVLRRPDGPVLTAVVLFCTGLVVLWLVSRTVGLPQGVEGGVVEPVGWPDLLCVAVELAAVALVGPLRRRSLHAVRLGGEQLAWFLIVVAGTGAVVGT